MDGQHGHCVSDRGAGSQRRLNPELHWKCRCGHQEQSEGRPSRGEAGGHPSSLILLLPDLVPTPKCCQEQISAPRLLQEPPTIPESTLHTSTFQHGNPGAAVAEVQPSPGGVEPELRLLLLGAGWTGPQGHLRVGLWARRGARQAPLSAQDWRSSQARPCAHREGWMSRSHPDDGHQGTGETASQHRAGKPLAVKTLGAGTRGGYWHEPSAAKGPGQGNPGSPGGFWTGIPPHTHVEKQKVLGTPSSPPLLLRAQPHAKSLPQQTQKAANRARAVGSY